LAGSVISLFAVSAEQLRQLMDVSRFGQVFVKARSETPLAHILTCEAGERDHE
jgi:hypothetical protein